MRRGGTIDKEEGECFENLNSLNDDKDKSEGGGAGSRPPF
jgi:hypothetical protein